MVTENRCQTTDEYSASRKPSIGFQCAAIQMSQSLSKPLVAVVTKALGAFGLDEKRCGSGRLSLAAVERCSAVLALGGSGRNFVVYQRQSIQPTSVLSGRV